MTTPRPPQTIARFIRREAILPARALAGTAADHICTPANAIRTAANRICTLANAIRTPANRICTPANAIRTPADRVFSPEERIFSRENPISGPAHPFRQSPR